MNELLNTIVINKAEIIKILNHKGSLKNCLNKNFIPCMATSPSPSRFLFKQLILDHASEMSLAILLKHYIRDARHYSFFSNCWCSITTVASSNNCWNIDQSTQKSLLHRIAIEEGFRRAGPLARTLDL